MIAGLIIIVLIGFVGIKTKIIDIGKIKSFFKFAPKRNKKLAAYKQNEDRNVKYAGISSNQ